MPSGTQLHPIGKTSSFNGSHRHVLSFRSYRDPSINPFESVLIYRFPTPPGQGPSTPKWYGIANTCPHLGAPLEQGSIEIDIEDFGSEQDSEQSLKDEFRSGTPIIMCPWHSMDFNLSNGASSMTDLRACTYTVECRGDELWMEFPGSPGDDYRLLGIRAVSEQFVNAPYTAATAVPSPTYDLVNEPPKTVASFARMVLLTSDPDLKVNLTRELVARFRNGQLKVVGLSTDPPPPDEPPRPASVRVVVPGKAPKIGKGGTVASRVKMLHALASIEQWAIDLALDVIARFWKWKVGSLDGQSGTKLPLAFFADHLQVALDEAKHFTLLRERMREIDGTQYGDLPVHHGLWESAHETRASLFSRLAIIGLVHESRGLDTNPRQISRCRAAGDHASADMLQIIHDDEITHVACGHRHFTHLCTSLAPDPVDPVAQFKAEVRAHFYGGLRGPFNADDRARAGLDAAWYENLQGRRYGPGVVDGDEGEGGGARAGRPGSDAVTPSARGSTLSPTLSPTPPPPPAPDALDSRMQRLEIKV